MRQPHSWRPRRRPRRRPIQTRQPHSWRRAWALTRARCCGLSRSPLGLGARLRSVTWPTSLCSSIGCIRIRVTSHSPPACSDCARCAKIRPSQCSAPFRAARRMPRRLARCSAAPRAARMAARFRHRAPSRAAQMAARFRHRAPSRAAQMVARFRHPSRAARTAPRPTETPAWAK